MQGVERVRPPALPSPAHCMKFMPLIWSGLWRKPGRSILIFLQVAVAFGRLHGMQLRLAQPKSGLSSFTHLGTPSTSHSFSSLAQAKTCSPPSSSSSMVRLH